MMLTLKGLLNEAPLCGKLGRAPDCFYGTCPTTALEQGLLVPSLVSSKVKDRGERCKSLRCVYTH